ncbi:hypothetical protein RRG08_054038 [Elysia crispata]|uniref:Uncharacterized protein n=1 Tax=Elysia crispata TaxID=231223 RepID=A0AAE0Z9T4_9GAST|nr:hypothetical protein RRG08_054038 [Elysia crispata]
MKCVLDGHSDLLPTSEVENLWPHNADLLNVTLASLRLVYWLAPDNFLHNEMVNVATKLTSHLRARLTWDPRGQFHVQSVSCPVSFMSSQFHVQSVSCPVSFMSSQFHVQSVSCPVSFMSSQFHVQSVSCPVSFMSSQFHVQSVSCPVSFMSSQFHVQSVSRSIFVDKPGTWLDGSRTLLAASPSL